MMDDDMMMMPMTFSSHVDIGPLLFASWEVTNDSQYAVAIIVTLLMGIAFEFVRHIRPALQQYLVTGCSKHLRRNLLPILLQPHNACNEREAEAALINNGAEHSRTRGRKAASVPGRVLDTVLMMVQLTLAYLLMLIAMVYNTGLFIAVIAGCGAGHFLYGKCDYESGSCH
eukprot:m.312033 g.312033  ORF g.312033 m.312033 type:complete len:171 (+) comp55380_c0_seq7:455-967(+)